MEQILTSLAESIPVVAVLLFWIISERKEKAELIAYHRSQAAQSMRIILSLIGGDETSVE